MEFAEAWEKEFARIKEKAVKEENFNDSFTKENLKDFLATSNSTIILIVSS